MDLNKTFKLELKLSELLSCLNQGNYRIDEIHTMYLYFSWGDISVDKSTMIRVKCAGCGHSMIFYIHSDNILLNCDNSPAHPEIPYSAYCEDCIDAMSYYDYRELEDESYRIMEAYPQ